MFIPSKKDLPVLIHGREGHGASFFSVKMVAEFVKKGSPLIFWSGYHMAKDEFKKEFGGNIPEHVKIIENENPVEIGATLENISEEQILFVKNFELVPNNLMEKILERKLLIICGDLEKALTKEEVLKFPTRIFFTPYPGIEIPELEKYQGYIFSKNKAGETLK